MKIELGNINKVVAVGLHLNDDKVTFNYVILKMTKGEIAFEKIHKQVNDLKELVKQITTRHPILIHFSGKGILNRKIKREENYRHTILLNAQLDDFYFTDCLEDKVAFSSVIRKNQVIPWLTEFAKNKLNVIGISSGPFIAAPLVSFFDKSIFVVDGIEISMSDDVISDFKRAENLPSSVKIGHDRIDSDVLGPVALAANFFNPSPKLILTTDDPIFLTNLAEAKQKNIFYRFGTMLMLFFLIFLTANYFYLGYINSKIEKNYKELSEFDEQLALLNDLTEEQNRKENLLRSSGLLNQQFLSFYLMELSHSVPEEIGFETITVRPLAEAIRKKQKIEFLNQQIEITGISANSDILSRWIEKLESDTWISKVDIVDYRYEKNAGHFMLEIEVNQ